MSTTPGAGPALEDRLRAALAARAELVGPEDLAPIAPVAPLRPPRWRSPWVLLASAAVVLLVLGVVLRGLDRDPRSDDIAPRPDEPSVVLPPDVGRDWEADDLSSVARLDLDGDGVREKVEFLAEPSKDFDGRTRLQTTLSSTGEEAYGIAELGSTIGTSPLAPIDADTDGDQELVLWYDDAAAGPGGGGHPLVFDLRDGLLVQALVDDPELLARGHVPVPGGAAGVYEMVHVQDYWVEDGRLWSARSRSAYAAGNMTLHRPERVVLDAYTWTLADDGVLRASAPVCRTDTFGERERCGPDEADSLPLLAPAATRTVGEGQQADYGEGFTFTGRITDGVLVARLGDGRTLELDVGLPDPLLNTQQPTGVFYDGASFVVTSDSDPSRVEVVVQRGERLRVMEPVGEVPLEDSGDVRTWLTGSGSLVTAVADGDAWRTWQWEMVSGREIAALPTGRVCFDDVEDPSTARRC